MSTSGYYPTYSQHNLNVLEMANHSKLCIVWKEGDLIICQMVLAKIEEKVYRLCLIATNPRYRLQGYTSKVVALAAIFLNGKVLIRSEPLPNVPPYVTQKLSETYTHHGINWIIEDD